jgi:transcriptional regulatory protein RtcR
MSALFGHVKGAFTGALKDRPGLLKKADGGMLFLDEVGELGPDEQAMLLRAVEERSFYPVGADEETRSDFMLIAGTNLDLRARVAEGRFREDLLARIDLWTFRLPSLRERSEDLVPNLQFELEQASQALGKRTSFSKEAQARFLEFASSPEGKWPGNFRDFNAAVKRMSTLAVAGRITSEGVDEELGRLRAQWADASGKLNRVEQALGARAAELDLFDRVQLEGVLEACAGAKSLSEAGRLLFSRSRAKKQSPNDADRLRKYLARFGLRFGEF